VEARGCRRSHLRLEGWLQRISVSLRCLTQNPIGSASRNPARDAPHTGLSRTSLVELLDEVDPSTGEPLIKQMRVERHGKQRRIRMIHRESLLRYLDTRANHQALAFVPGVNNPDDYSVDDVVSSQELFQLFVGEDNLITEVDWQIGKLSTRKARLVVLRSLRLLA